jgi:magnesium transporter
MAKKKHKKAGLPPGSIVFTGAHKVGHSNIVVTTYNEVNITETAFLGDFSQKSTLLQPDKVTWTDVRHLQDIHILEQLGATFVVHPLVLEDIADTSQRPKFEDYDGGLYFIAHDLKFNDKACCVEVEQISIYFGKNFVLSFQEDADDSFLTVRQRLLSGEPKLRKHGADYLAYSMADYLVDKYFTILDRIESEIESLEIEVAENPSYDTKKRVTHLKSQMLTVRKYILPLREAINRFSHCNNGIIQSETQFYVRDLYDHCVRAIEQVEYLRERTVELQNTYLAEIGFRANGVIQILTIISSIFIPLTFIAGLYGMNFEYMPELHWRYGYFMVLGLMAMIAGSLLVYFKRKKWL